MPRTKAAIIPLVRRAAAGRGIVGAAAVLAALVPAVLPACGAADLAEIRVGGALRVLAAVDDEPAWFALRGSQSPGFEREVLEGFARLHKLRFDVVPITRWEDAIPMLVRGEGDVLGGVSATPERRKRVDFSGELLPVRVVVVTRRPARPIRTLGELREARLVVVPGTSWADALEKAGVSIAKAIKVADIAGAIEAIRVGHADATVSGAVDFFLQRRKHADLEAGMALGEAHSSAWAVRKDCPQLRQALDAYLTQLRASPNWSRLLVKYFGSDAPAILGRDLN